LGEETEKLTEFLSSILKIPKDSIDLSKLIHIKTQLNVSGHEKIVKAEIFEYLKNMNPRIDLTTSDVIYMTIRSTLEKCQKYESLPDTASFEEIKQCKGFSKNNMDSIIGISIQMNVPPIDTILENIPDASEENKNKIESAYAHFISDQITGNKNQKTLLDEIKNIIDATNIKNETIWEIAQICSSDICKNNLIFRSMKNGRYYVALATIIYLINEGRNYEEYF